MSDITYVRLGRVDVFLAVVMDAFSRKVVGWNLGPKRTEALTALRNAIESRQPAPGRFIIPIAVCNTRLPLTRGGLGAVTLPKTKE